MQSMAQSCPQISKTLTSAMIQSYWPCASCTTLPGTHITILCWFFMMHENASTHHWQMQTELQCTPHTVFLRWSKVHWSQSASFLGEIQLFFPPFPHFRFYLNSSYKAMVPAFSTMHEEKWKALSHLNCKHSESLEEDKANIKNHKKYAPSTPEFLLHTDTHLILL